MVRSTWFAAFGFLAGLLCSLPVVCADNVTQGGARPITFPPERGDVLILPLSAIDGDTIRFAFLVDGVGRLSGINAPELHGKEAIAGKASREFLDGELPIKPVVAQFLGKEKFGRYLIQVPGANGEDLSETMIAHQMAKRWDGKGAKP